MKDLAGNEFVQTETTYGTGSSTPYDELRALLVGMKASLEECDLTGFALSCRRGIEMLDAARSETGTLAKANEAVAYLSGQLASQVGQCKHEPFEGRCVHCNAPFVNGRAAP